jgi:hypothetical protein
MTAWKQFFKAAWKDFFQGRFRAILDDLRRNRELLENQANLVQIKEWRQAWQKLEDSLEASERERKHRETLTVLNWLSAPDANLDQEQLSARREEFPDRGRWILKEPGIRDWLNHAIYYLPLFWLNGKPGSGESTLDDSLFLSNFTSL